MIQIYLQTLNLRRSSIGLRKNIKKIIYSMLKLTDLIEMMQQTLMFIHLIRVKVWKRVVTCQLEFMC